MLSTALACGCRNGVDLADASSEPSSVLDAEAGTSQPEAGLLVETDAAPDVMARLDCTNDGLDCDDGLFCNGLERCEPSASGADARGCVQGPALACSPGRSCDETAKACSLCRDDGPNDSDGDGHEADSCGGDDCRDNDTTIHPGAAEVCNGVDDDCDGGIDGDPAAAACASSAPTGARGECNAGRCIVACTDPDFDLRAEGCVRHDDCGWLNDCGPWGTCLDGVRSYSCECPSGFEGTGTAKCTDIDECALDSHGCDTHPPACYNQLFGRLSCDCPSDYWGNGVGEQGCARRVQTVSAGTRSTCAILSGGGEVACWGDNSFGLLGVGGAAIGSGPGQMGNALKRVPLDRKAVTIAVGSDLTCAILEDGAAKCWGYNGYGTVGGERNADGLQKLDAPLPAGTKAIEIAAGSGYGYALLDDGSVGKWGREFVVYPLGGRAIAFDRSPLYDGAHLCAVLDSGVLKCWASTSVYSNDHGTLGPGYVSGSEAPVTIDLGSEARVRQVALGNQHSCALLEDSTVKCWGRNDYGQLGLGDTAPRGLLALQMGDNLPTVPLGDSATAIAAGAHHTCALLTQGVAKCWGLNDQGQLGQGHTNTLGDQPGEVAALAAIDLGGWWARAIDVGSHSCAKLDWGMLKCWGPNAYGQLGQGNTVPRGKTPDTMGAALLPIELGD